jgi:hypothetical protein
MKRSSYSNLMWNSALYGHKFLLKDQLHTDLLVWADTLPKVAAYTAYYPEFSYFDGKKEKKSSYPLAVQFDDGRTELWATSWHPVKGDSAVERARQGHANSLGATYVLRTLRDLEDNRVELKNRRTMQCFLFQGRGLATDKIEEHILRLLAMGAMSLEQLVASARASTAVIQLAVFRLLRAARISVPLSYELISPKWLVEGANHARP